MHRRRGSCRSSSRRTSLTSLNLTSFAVCLIPVAKSILFMPKVAKIYRVIQIKLNQFKKMSIRSLTYRQSVFKRYHSDKHLSEFLPTRWRQKSTGKDMGQNYVTVTLCADSEQLGVRVRVRVRVRANYGSGVSVTIGR